ncbi:MAG: RmuC-domain protein [Candidatus Roizmanbacteria bacterium GW2011_GWC2_37_13]|uniref:RmuC-domain protein n=1 Tax=Candidatus Roizmanbacteria bacterium GW2011_GWC2_37_13 TaxID=1618486 RepID=A0A0G0G5W4_9BACT|nr:MAG: RmuC-domain protein [Candidatus Roizmanbacteria bacterium GW2011_GWC1_37_12]KKQ25447.1 MAG: RmuC-domain protein [Candidatus Roizmanbacteria bacterium GW2011_GWC2_37_13]
MIVYIIVTVVIALALIFVTFRFILPDITKKAIEQLVQMSNEKLGAEKQDIKTDLDNKKSAFEKIARDIKELVEKTENKIEKTDKERIGSFGQLKQAIENQAKVTEQLSVTTESLKRVLSNNQMRGQFGEQVAENLLKMSGFVKGVDYDFNKEQKSSGTRPDFVIYLPNKIKINVDVKFPYQSLQKMTETQDKATKNELEKTFERDVREKIKQVTGREYINPEGDTVDFVVMFIPNEMIFSYIYEKMNDLWVEAMKQKVVLAGPFSFTAILRLVRQAYDNFKYQKNVQKIIGYIKNFEVEFVKYNEEFLKIGERIDSLSKQYNVVNSTRSNQLTRSIDKIKIEDSSSNKLLT